MSNAIILPALYCKKKQSNSNYTQDILYINNCVLIYHYIEFHPRMPWVSSGNPKKKDLFCISDSKPTLDQRLIDEPKYQSGVYKIVVTGLHATCVCETC